MVERRHKLREIFLLINLYYIKGRDKKKKEREKEIFKRMLQTTITNEYYSLLSNYTVKTLFI